MASNTICLGKRQACALRVTRLDANCNAVVGDDNAVVTTGLITANLDPDIEEGTNYEPKNACDDILWTAEEADTTKRYTGDLELGIYDYELIELLTDASLIVGAASSPWVGQNIGVSYPGPLTAAGGGVALEVWTNATGLGNLGSCGTTAANPPYIRHVFPNVLVTPGAVTFENDMASFKATLKATANSTWGIGPWNDWPGATGVPADAPHAEVWDSALPTTACGYIAVPALT